MTNSEFFGVQSPRERRAAFELARKDRLLAADGASMEARLAAAESAITTLQSDLTATQGDLDTAEAALAAAEDDIVVLEAKKVPRFWFVEATRIVNTNYNTGTATVTVPSTVDGISMSGADGLFMSMTATDPTSGTAGSGFVVAFPYVDAYTQGSNVNHTAGESAVNGFGMVRLDSSRRFKIYVQGRQRLILDVVGMYWDDEADAPV